ncbi:MAG: HAD family hydrolase [bacterium]|nr:HAD family hydrolase [bacterium]
MKKAIFLDRDGTLIKDRGALKNIGQVEFYKNIFDGLRRFQKEYLLFIITNQPYIAKGMLKTSEVRKVHSYILKKLREKRIIIKAVYFCPHKKEDNCDCRKPKPYFLNKAAEKYNIDLKASYVIGDHLSDMELALNAGSKGVYMLCGHGWEQYLKVRAIKDKRISICRNLCSALKRI